MEEESSLVTDEVILTDVCDKSNKKIHYIAQRESVLIKPSRISPWNLCEYLKSVVKDIFLPRGYPESVSNDYLEYQLWDTCQAFCSCISGTLAMSAVMQGIGVGLDTATPVSAAVTWLIKDGTGMIGSILFTWAKGSKLDSDCKKWRLFADILNDIALITELCIPFFMEYSIQMICIATAFKALVGTAGSSTRAAIVTHQAKKGNIADVSAKDGSQEIFTNLFAFIFGIFMLKYVTETKHTWLVMCTATLFHIIFNYKAVRCLQLNVFNSQRLCLSLRTYLPTSIVPTVEQINKRESVFLFTGVTETSICGFSFSFGSSVKKAVKSPEVTAEILTFLVALFSNKKYLILPHLRKKKLFISFPKSFRDYDVLKAYFHACLLAISLNYLGKKKKLQILARGRKNSPIYRLKNILREFFETEDEHTNISTARLMEAYITCEDFIEKEFKAFCDACEDEDWIVDKHLININDWRAEWKSKKDKSIHFRLSSESTSKAYNSHSKTSKNQRPNNKMNVLIIS